MIHGLEQQKLAVQSGSWPVYRYDPRLAEKGENPLQIECKEPTVPVSQYAYNETRYKMLTQLNEERPSSSQKAQKDAGSRCSFTSRCSRTTVRTGTAGGSKVGHGTYPPYRSPSNPLIASASPLPWSTASAT
jgi:hypothetical protein